MDVGATFRKISGFLCLILLSGCLNADLTAEQINSTDVVVNSSEPATTSVASGLAISSNSGSTTLLAGACNALTVYSIDGKGTEIAVENDVIVALSVYSGSGNFYFDSACVGAVATFLTLTEGISSTQVYFRDTAAETAQIAASSAELSFGSLTMTIVAGSASSANSAINGTGPIKADGISTSVITIVLKDDYGNSLVGTTPTFLASGSSNLYDACSATDSSGIATCTLRSTSAGSKALSITSPSYLAGGSVTFTPVLFVATNGSDANSGYTATTPKLTIGAAISLAVAGAEIRVAQGTYETGVTLKTGVVMKGGYSSDFSTRDTMTYASTIQTSATSYTVQCAAGNDSSTVLDGFTIYNMNGGTYTYAIMCSSGNPVISHNVVHVNSAGTAINRGIYAIYSPIIRNNDIYLGSVISQNHGIVCVSSTCSAEISGNTINGGALTSGSAAAYGISAEASYPRIFNNLIYPGTSASIGYSYGIYSYNSQAVVTNNTIIGGSAGLNYGIYINNFSGTYPMTITNNIIANVSGITNAFGLFESTPEADPGSVQNNLFLGYSNSGNSYVYKNEASTNITNPNTLNLEPINGGAQTSRYDGNLVMNDSTSSLFMNWSGPDGLAHMILDNNWRVVSTYIAVTQGGKSTIINDCGPTGTSGDCGDVTTNIAGETRTSPYSIGAY